MLKNRWVLVGLALILAGVFFIDYVAELLYPSVELGSVRVPDTLGGAHTYNFYKDTSLVGTYNYSVAKISGGAQVVYAMSSVTSLTFEGKPLTLEGLYRFNSDFSPISYELNATEENGIAYYVCDFKPGAVTTSVSFQGETVDVETEVGEGTFLIENSMPGYWEILFQSTSLDRGKRYTFDAFIPQAAKVFHVTLVVEKDLEQVRVDEETLECTVIKASDLGLAFYVNQGEIVQYRNEEQGVLMSKTS